MFTLTDAQMDRIRAWSEEQDKLWIEQEKSTVDTFRRGMAEAGIAYYGSIGGALTYHFTPTSLGVVQTIDHAGTGAKLDVTEYDGW